MKPAKAAVDLEALDLARECLHRFLAAALSDPRDGLAWGLLSGPENQNLAREAALLLRSWAADQLVAPGCGELPPDRLDVGPMLEALRAPGLDFQAEYDRVFGLVPSRECPPFETEYCSSTEAFFRAQQLADVAGFYRAFGLEPSRSVPTRPDHLALELEFLAFLLLKKRLAGPEEADHVQVCEEAEQAFFREHVAWWAPSFAMGLRRKAGQGFYLAAGELLAAFLPVERAYLGVEPPRLPLQAAYAEPPDEQAGCASGCSTPGEAV